MSLPVSIVCEKCGTVNEASVSDYMLGTHKTEPAPKQDDLTEICQLHGQSIYVRLDWRDPEVAKETLDRIRFTIKDAFSRAYGWFERPEDQDALRDANTKAGGQ